MGKQAVLDESTVNGVVSKAKMTSTEESLFCSPPSLQDRCVKAVTFGDLRIRYHAVVLGNHPCCSSGCPLQLGWDHTEETVVLSLEDFESSRERRKTRAEMQTTWQERREILSRLSDRDILLNHRKLQRSRRVDGDLSSFFLNT